MSMSNRKVEKDMSWNYRVIGKLYKQIRIYQIYECYYDTEGNIHSWSVDPMNPFGETIDELRQDLLMMRAAFCEPIINYEDLPGSKDTEEEDDDTLVSEIEYFVRLRMDNKDSFSVDAIMN